MICDELGCVSFVKEGLELLFNPLLLRVGESQLLSQLIWNLIGVNKYLVIL